jgi:hypothetical protein
MRPAIPPMHAEVAARKERLPQAHDGHKTPRLQMRDLLASRQAHTRPDVSRLLGSHRHPMSRWLARDAAGGLDAWLATDVPTGTPVSLAPDVLASLEDALHRPEGFASDEALRQWGRRTHGVAVTDNTLSSLVRARFHATRNVARPRHTQKAGGDSGVPGHLA